MNTRSKYSQELVDEARRLVLVEGLTRQAAADRLNVPRLTVSDWVSFRKRVPPGLKVPTQAERKAKEHAAAERARRERELKRGEKPHAIHWPTNAEAFYCGLFYKRGVHGRVFFFDGEQWRKSSLKSSDITWSFRSLG